MARTGHTYTLHFDLETKQHELLGWDLGEGVSRKTLVIGLLLFGIWTGGLLLLFGPPSKFTFTLYAVPPIVIAYYGTQRSRRVDRRWNITNWALAIRYLVVGHRPIICGGRRSAARVEWIPRRARWGAKGDVMSDLAGGASLGRILGHPQDYQAVAGSALRLDARSRLYGPDHLYKARQKEGASK